MKSKKKPKKKSNPIVKIVRDYVNDIDGEMLVADEFAEAFMGVSAQNPGRPMLAVYDYGKCVKILMRNGPMSEEDAVDYIEYNTTGAWHGDRTPIFLHPFEN